MIWKNKSFNKGNKQLWGRR